MKLIFLGSGAAFTVGKNNFQSNMLLENDQHQYLLIDCGSDIRLSLYEQSLTHEQIHDVYISHLHADHSGGLEWLAFNSKFNNNGKKPNLYISDSLVEPLWNKVLSGGLSSLADEQATLDTYFKVHPIIDNEFIWNNLPIHAVRTKHYYSDKELMPSYGVFFKADDHQVFITTDTQFWPEQYLKYYEKADIIFHDCEVGASKSTVHSTYEELCTLPQSIKQKMWLYHYFSDHLPDAKADGFRGFVVKGQVFDFTNPKSL